MMFDLAMNFSEVLGGLMFVVWAPAGYRVGQLAYRPDLRRTRRRARWILVHLALGYAALAVQLVLSLLLWQLDWDFASNRIAVALPLMLIPAAAAAAVAVPRLWRLARLLGSVGTAGPPAADPRLVVPVQAAGIAGFLDFWTVMVDRPAPPYGRYLTVMWLVLLSATGLLWVRQMRRHAARLGAQPPSRPRVWARILHGAGGTLAVAAALAGLVVYGISTSRVPDQVNMGAMSVMDWGGGSHEAGTAAGMPGMPGMTSDTPPAGGATRSVPDLTGDVSGTPKVRYTLIAQQTDLSLSSGRHVKAWTFNGQAPGPTLVLREGEPAEITLVNHLPSEGVTVHWHGLDVPNAEDGVAGLTQDAVQPGHSFVYRFRPHQAGTFWYHSHQASSESVDRGLFGPLVVLPAGHGTCKAAGPDCLGKHNGTFDLPVLAHTWTTTSGDAAEALAAWDSLHQERVEPGTRVRLRLGNTSDNTHSDTEPRVLSLTGTDATVTGIDGTKVHGPTPVSNLRIQMPIGGRYDVEFTMPDHPVQLTDELSPDAGILLSPDGTGRRPPMAPAAGATFDPAHYGSPAPVPFGQNSRFDRRFKLILDDGPGFYDGQFTFPPNINGHVFPDTPMLMVTDGDLVETTIVNRGHVDHPMHLHGHHALVLARNGRPTTGSPWWTDTLEVQPGDKYTLAFRADNPGLWMDHCHNLQHAATGMVLHLGYTGVTTPYRVGRLTHNHPE